MINRDTLVISNPGTGKTALHISNSMNINIDAIISNSEYHKIEKGIYYGENISAIFSN